MSNFEPSPAFPRGAAPAPPDFSDHHAAHETDYEADYESDQSAVRDSGPGVDEASAPALNRSVGAAAAAAPVQQSLALQPLPERRGQDAPPRRQTRPRYLWLGIHLPVLPLEAVCRPQESKEPAAVFEECQGVRRIVQANRAAERQGVAAGLPVNAALALLPALELLRRDPGREMRVLESLAVRAGRFTSLVSIEAPDGLLLEAAGSLRLFGGSESLRRQVETDFSAAGFTASLAIAPTPLASTWLSRSGTSRSGTCTHTASIHTMVTHTEYLAGALGWLPLQCLRWPAAVCESLNGMGMTSIGDCLRLPREGFARRFGALRLLELDRALGRLPDPRAGYRAPERFCRECELDEEEDDRERLLDACRGLLGELERFLIARQVVVQRLKLDFFHLKAPSTRLTVGCLEPGLASRHWYELLAMKLDRLALPAPVIAIRLESGHTQAFTAATGALRFDQASEPLSSCQSTERPVMPAVRLLERLAARIGEDAVHGVTAVAEHRPQRAWRTLRATGRRIPQHEWSGLPGKNDWYARQAPQLRLHGAADGSGEDAGLLLRRPLWMLAEPRPLEVEQEVPQYQGPLRFENGPERLETGWWDDNGIARDYFTAVNPKGVYLWIYRSRRGQRGWYLHGIFA